MHGQHDSNDGMVQQCYNDSVITMMAWYNNVTNSGTTVCHMGQQWLAWCCYGTWDNCGSMVQQWHMGQQWQHKVKQYDVCNMVMRSSIVMMGAA